MSIIKIIEKYDISPCHFIETTGYLYSVRGNWSDHSGKREETRESLTIRGAFCILRVTDRTDYVFETPIWEISIKIVKSINGL